MGLPDTHPVWPPAPRRAVSFGSMNRMARKRRYDEELEEQLAGPIHPAHVLTGATSVRTAPPLTRDNVVMLQRTAGNHQVGRMMIARQGYRDEELLAEEYAEEAKGSFSKAKERVTRWWGDLFGEKKPDTGPEKASEVMDDSLKVAKYVDDGLRAAQGTLNLLAGDIPTSENRKKLKEVAEGFGDAADKLGKAKKTVDWINDKIQLYEDTTALVRAIQVLRKKETTAEEAAVAFDALFAAAGRLGGKLPDGPWSAYFEFLAAFESQGGFFANMIKKFMPANRVSGYDAETMKLLETNRVWDTVNR
jgi:hypothetical protein